MQAFTLLVKCSEETETKITTWCFIKSDNVAFYAALSSGLVACVQTGWTQ